jgi:putative nucleotidyltransferase with HDIG domain
MNKPYPHTLIIAAVIILGFNAQALLLTPHLMAALLDQLSATAAVSLASLFFLIASLLAGAILLQISGRKHGWINLAGAAALITLALIYFRANLPIEMILLISLGFTTILILLPFNNSRFNLNHWVLYCAIFVNAAAAILILLPEQTQFIPRDYNYEQTGQILFGAAFAVSAVIGLAAAIKKWLPDSALGQILALPWLLWATIFINYWNVPGLIISILFAVNLIWIDGISSERISLPADDQVGSRIFWTTAITLGILLGLLTKLTWLAESAIRSAYALHQMREAALLLFTIACVFGSHIVLSFNLSLNGVRAGLQKSEMQNNTPGIWSGFFASWLKPYDVAWQAMRSRVEQHEQEMRALNDQLLIEKRRAAQLNLLNELNHEFTDVIDLPVAAQLVVKAVQSGLCAALCVVYTYDTDSKDFVVTATAGEYAGSLPPDHHISAAKGLAGRAAKLRRTQLASDTRLDPENFQSGNPAFLSELIVPLLHKNQIKGLMIVDDINANAFDDSDIRTLEAAAIQLTSAWERSLYDQRLMSLIEGGAGLSTSLDVEAVLHQTAQMVQKILDARFAFVALGDRSGGYTRSAHAGYAPTLQGLLSRDPGGNALVQTAMNSPQAFRIRDVRKRFSSTIPAGAIDTRSMLAVPIQIKRQGVGAILAFGKQKDASFSESDEALARLLSVQSAAAIESAWLYREQQTLHQLMIGVIQSDDLTQAAEIAVRSLQQFSKAVRAGCVLFGLDKQIEAQYVSAGTSPDGGTAVPHMLIEQVMVSGQKIISGDADKMLICLPLKTPHRQYGVLWLDVPENQWYNELELYLQQLINQIALALESRILLNELEITYDQTLAALSSALDARDRETEGHSLRVARIAGMLGEKLGLTPEQAKQLERGSILHDIGKIGVRDSILLKPGPLNEDEWKQMRQHTDIGASIVANIPFLQEAMPVIYGHHERWNGSGYPLGLKGNDIPFVARIFAVADNYDALTSLRPYRERNTPEEALDYLKEKANVLFDGQVVKAMETLYNEGRLTS